MELPQEVFAMPRKYSHIQEHGLRQVLFAKRVPVKQEVKPPVAVWLEQTVR